MHRGTRFLLQSLLVGGAVLGAMALPGLWGSGVATAQGAAANPHPAFDRDIAPVFNKYCVACHSGPQPKADIMLKFKDENDARSRMATNDEFWDKVTTMVGGGMMPPATVKNRPSDDERKLLVNWIKNDMLTMGGNPDPGPVIVHRLNNREYAYKKQCWNEQCQKQRAMCFYHAIYSPVLVW